MDRKILALSLFVLFFITAPALHAQSFDELLGGFSTSRESDEKTDYVTVEASYHSPFLVLSATVKQGWHIYAFTQKEGATLPAQIAFDNLDVAVDGPIRPTSIPKREHLPYYDVPLESFEGKVIWLIPLRYENDEPQTISGTLSGQVCQGGEGGACVPVAVKWKTAASEKIDLPTLQAAVATVPKEYWYHPQESTTQATIHESGQVTADLITESESENYRDFVAKIQAREFEQVGGVGIALIYALFGGLILNVMPCVLPVIGLKILSFFQQAGQSRVRAFLLNLWYAAGMLAVFMLLATMSVGLSKLFTYSIFNIVMCIVVFAMALSLMDIWTLSAPSFLGQGKSAELMQQEGALGAFFKGIITTLLAIPCGAPLLSPALGWADAQIRSGQTGQVFLLYGTIGLGMALPYLLLGAFPELLRFLPKPGEWMDTFKKTMGFCLLIAVVWILYFIEMSQVVPMVAVLFAIWFACWFIGKEQNLATKDKRTFKAWIVSAVVVVSTILISFDIPRVAFPYTLERAMQRRLDDWSGVRTQGHWIPYSDGRLFENLVEQKRLVLVDFTADWCVNCKVLESTVLESQEVLSELDRRGIVSLQANISRSDEAKKLLNQLGPESVPAMAIFSADRPLEPVVIRGNYGAKTLIKQIP